MLVFGADHHTHQTHFHFPSDFLKTNDRAQNLPQQELNPEEKKEVEELKKTDAEVRRHERAHKAAAGQFALGGPKFEYVTGPDGRRYVTGGEVQIDTSEVANDPEATIRKAQQIKRAALAPRDPSAQDRRVAAEASRMEAKARSELAKEKQEEKQLYTNNGKTAGFSAQPAVLDLFI